jgi:hypothetical protein
VTPSVWTDLPPELLPAIFEDLQDGALRSCALVRRQWRWPAQRRLFRYVVVYPHKQFLRHDVVYAHKQFLRLTEILRASPHLCPFVKDIPGLETTSPDAETVVRADGLFPAVEELRVRGQNLAITAYLPQLRILKKWEEFDAEDPQVPSARLPIALERIKFLNRGELLPEWFTLWVARTETLAAQSLKELRIHSRRPADGSTPAYMQAFLRAHAHLDLLELSIMDPTDQGRPGASFIMLVLSDA